MTNTKGPLSPHHCCPVASAARNSSHGEGETRVRCWRRKGGNLELLPTQSWAATRVHARQKDSSLSLKNTWAKKKKREKMKENHPSHLKCQWLGCLLPSSFASVLQRRKKIFVFLNSILSSVLLLRFRFVYLLIGKRYSKI